MHTDLSMLYLFGDEFLICGGATLYLLGYTTTYNNVNILFKSSDVFRGIILNYGYRQFVVPAYGTIYAKCDPTDETQAWTGPIQFTEVNDEPVEHMLHHFDLTSCMRGFNQTTVWEPIDSIVYTHPLPINRNKKKETLDRIQKYKRRASNNDYGKKLLKELEKDQEIYDKYLIFT
jgi:hypothetical protein